MSSHLEVGYPLHFRPLASNAIGASVADHVDKWVIYVDMRRDYSGNYPHSR